MSDVRPPPRSASVRSRAGAWLLFSCAVHVLLLVALRADQPHAEGPRLRLRSNVEFGLVEGALPGTAPAAAPVPAKLAPPKPAPKRALKPRAASDPNAFNLAVDAGTADPHARETASTASASGNEPGDAARSGQGSLPGAEGDGSGTGLGDGYAPAGATLAYNVDLARVRKTALVLESTTLLEMIPEWQALLGGSGIDPLHDLERIFVATPNLERSSLIVSARHHLPRERIAAAVQQLASEQGQPAAFSDHSGIAVAPWRNRGPTKRVIALTGTNQFTISRTTDLARVLGVAEALTRVRGQQGFDQHELAEQGGLLAMQPNEAVALWIEDVANYVRVEGPGVPQALRLSIYHVDQFTSELRVRGQYGSASAATAALSVMDALRKRFSDDPKVIYLGLKSALDAAQIEQDRAALSLRVRLTLHQTRYLLRYLNRMLHASHS